MKIRSAFVLGMVLLFGSAAFAQDYPKVEVFADYSYIHANPQNNNIIGTFSLNGGGGGGAFFLNKYLGIKAEFEGYGSFQHNLTIAGGTPVCPGISSCLVTASGNLFTYNIGPELKYRMRHFEPFAEVMFGGAHSNFYGNIFTACQGVPDCQTASKSPSNNAFDFIIGGGLDVPLTKSIAIRPVEFDYLLTRFGNGFTGGNNNQSNFRYQAGISFRF